MLRTALLASAFAVCAAAPAFAAPAQSWTGFYAGVNAGYGGDAFKYPAHGTYTDVTVDEDSDTTTNFNGTGSLTSSGYVGGGQAGYDYQLGGWVIGAVADIDATGIEGRGSISGSSVGNTNGSASAHISSKLDYLGTVRARVGLPIADGRFMPYVTAGMAYGQVNSSAAIDVVPAASENSSPTHFAASRNLTRVGWTVGAGAEYAITPQITFGAEYLYTDLGTATVLSGSATATLGNLVSLGDGDGSISGALGVKTTANIMRVTLNYRF
jgi:outer membrane immunogenic protein